MYEYRFVKVGIRFFSGSPDRDYHQIIERHAEEGWRFVQAFAPGTGVYGSAKYFELIFERPKGWTPDDLMGVLESRDD